MDRNKSDLYVSVCVCFRELVHAFALLASCKLKLFWGFGSPKPGGRPLAAGERRNVVICPNYALISRHDGRMVCLCHAEKGRLSVRMYDNFQLHVPVKCVLIYAS